MSKREVMFVEIIRAMNVEKQYKNGVTALYNINLSINKGEFVFVIGASGSGKSTLIKMMYREEKPTSGQIIVGGINVGKLRNGKVYKLRRKIGVVFQDYKLLPKLNVYENVAFALEVIGMQNCFFKKFLDHRRHFMSVDRCNNTYAVFGKCQVFFSYDLRYADWFFCKLFCNIKAVACTRKIKDHKFCSPCKCISFEL